MVSHHHAQIPLHPTLEQVTQSIRDKSKTSRAEYLQTVQTLLQRPDAQDRMGCANLAHAWAPLPHNDKLRLRVEKAKNIGVVTAYNDMLSAHQPYAGFLNTIKEQARMLGMTAQVAGGTPAMCDGITQGYEGMEMSLFSRDVIAMSTAVALSHDVFDAALLLGVCDKIVPGLLIGALQFGHLPCVFVPAGPMSSGLSNKDKSAVREQFAKGEVGRETLLDAENAAYHSVGTCTFYGTANSNQMLLEAMGLHIPNAAFIPPNTPEREQYTRQAVNALHATDASAVLPIGVQVDERCIVNAMVALLATGGSTNHLIHWVAVAKAAGICIDWSDFDALSAVVPLLARIYPNGNADVNDFQAAGGPQRIIAELVHAGLMHRLGSNSGKIPFGEYPLNELTAEYLTVVRPVSNPFATTGGVRLLQGSIGRSVIKVSAVSAQHQTVKAQARVFDSQQAVAKAFEAGELNRDVIVVVRFQGPKANGMPELHKLTPMLSILQGKGFQVALVTDGRMSGASGKVPAAIHVWPEAMDGGPIAKIQDGDWIELDAPNGRLNVLIDMQAFEQRSAAVCTTAQATSLGRRLFSNARRYVENAEKGACTW